MKKRPNNRDLKSDILPDINLPGLPAMFNGRLIQSLLTEHFKKIEPSISGCEISYIKI